MSPARFTMTLKGPSGEAVDLWRTLISHGVATLPPMTVDMDARTLEMTVAVPRSKPRMLTVRGAGKSAAVTVAGRPPGKAALASLRSTVARVLNLEEDLAEFYALAAEDEELRWAATGAGRMVRSPTLFEEVIKTICTTNCSWGLTTKMVSTLVQELGEPAVGAPQGTWRGRAFPTAEAMASAPEKFYREVVRAGYRSPYFVQLSSGVADGSIEIEKWGSSSSDELPDDKLDELLQSLPGVGPYASAHIMMMMGRYSRLILDSWTRPTYARLSGRKQVKDATIERRFRPYGRYAGLAFWLYLTRDWVEES
jgi:3-methyladenine DNA glycosylase/8-oxoguanine DNA glycosylase